MIVRSRIQADNDTYYRDEPIVIPFTLVEEEWLSLISTRGAMNCGALGFVGTPHSGAQ